MTDASNISQANDFVRTWED